MWDLTFYGKIRDCPQLEAWIWAEEVIIPKGTKKPQQKTTTFILRGRACQQVFLIFLSMQQIAYLGVNYTLLPCLLNSGEISKDKCVFLFHLLQFRNDLPSQVIQQ